MRTNLVLDDELVQQALALSRLRTKKDVVHTALKEYVVNHSRLDIRRLRGKVAFHKDYSYKSLRKE